MTFRALGAYEVPSLWGPPLIYGRIYEVALQRPDKLRVITVADGPRTEFYDDGKVMMSFHPAENLVAVADAPPTIDQALKKIFDISGTYFPFTDIVVADPWGDMQAGLTGAFYVGESVLVGGVTTDVVAYEDDGVFIQMWIGKDDRLPRMARAQFHDDPLQLRQSVQFTDWQLDPVRIRRRFHDGQGGRGGPDPIQQPADEVGRAGRGAPDRLGREEGSGPIRAQTVARSPLRRPRCSRPRFRIGLSAALTAVLASGPAAAWSHSNGYGGHTSGTAGDWNHSNAYGGSTSHEYGQGTEHTSAYGSSTSHSYYGGTSHTNVYGGTTTGAYGAGAYHTGPYGATAYHPPTYYGGAYYHPPAAYYPYPYHPYPTSCGGCGWAVAGAAMAGAAVGAAAASSSAQAASAASYQSGYAAGSASTAAATTNAYAAGVATGSANTAAAYNAGVASGASGTAHPTGTVVTALPSGAVHTTINGTTYFVSNGVWYLPSSGANGVVYTVVAAP